MFSKLCAALAATMDMATGAFKKALFAVFLVAVTASILTTSIIVVVYKMVN